MDALSEAMRSVRISSALFFDGEFGAPWRFASPGQQQASTTLSPESERLVLFHLVTEGEATARTVGHDDVALGAGDIVVFPLGSAHEMWNGRTSRLFPAARMLPRLRRGELATERWGGDGPVTRIVCGYFGCEPHADRSFLSGLPAVFKIGVRDSPTGAWIESAIRHAVSEVAAGRAGRSAVLARLAETLFAETLCRYMDALPPERTGWLAAARDPRIGQTLAQFQRDPARAWTLADLARASGMSRSRLADRFAELMGEPPLTWLARWRLQLAASRLVSTGRNVQQIAYDVGYESEAAFNRAFRRAFGMPPGRYRRERRAASAPGGNPP